MATAAERHTIENISFKMDKLQCSCDWVGNIAEFQPHRKEAGVVPGKVGRAYRHQRDDQDEPTDP